MYLIDTSVENSLILLHNDRDFDLMAGCIQELEVS
jgi:hypothetical protein